MNDTIRLYELKKYSMTDIEVKLFTEIIANKKITFPPESDRVQNFALMLRKSLENFFIIKKEIYQEFDMSY